ncbi:hypothetical protein [Haloarchaeobius baliensis]|uniref:hypothetical protein n=1 Tax=Haloarchaeobius baliensis TaxID=1670458 RepID=UPI003F88513B
MVETHWDDLRGRTVRFNGDRWELTGDVELRQSGALLALDARKLDDIRHEAAVLHFGVADTAQSLNPGSLGDHFDSIEQSPDAERLVVTEGARRYRYELQRLETA